ncbi:MAG: DUF4286 family protein [Flavobacteriales bacterium]|nr:DUF4286 family protein [Flavobacteriales bacterium]MCX7649809.1 DUF4286 family protein [Flavobacteriales bacterium]MDW8431564.1 DUF4286 family protein [Flavobacteriales bacterium]
MAGPIIYNVTINVDDEIREEWLDWMRRVHIPDVMNTGCFTSWRLCRLLVEEEKGTTFAIQYTAASLEDFEKYQKNFAAELQRQHSEKFRDRFVAFRTLLEQLE